MIADKKLLMKASELGILRSMPDFLVEPLKPGRLKRKFLQVEMIVDGELRKIFNNDPNFYVDNLQSLAKYLEKFGKITEWGGDKSEIHVASVVAFCLCFLENSKSNFTPKLVENLVDILDYYERADNMEYSDMWKGRKFNEEWETVNGKS